MIVKLQIEHHLEFLSLKEAAEARPSLHMSKCHISPVENQNDLELDFKVFFFFDSCC